MTDIVERLRFHIAIRGGPAKDDDGNYIGTTWPMILEAAGEIERLRETMVMTDNRLEAAGLGDEPACKHCIDVARSYLQEAMQPQNLAAASGYGHRGK